MFDYILSSRVFGGAYLMLRVVQAFEHYPKNLMRIIPTKGEKQ